MVYRVDRVPIQKIETMPNGALRVLGTIARVGELKYLMPSGDIRIENLTADELFNEKWLDSLANTTLTLGHPSERVTPENWKKYAVGSVGGVPIPNRSDGTLDFVHIINDAEAIAAVQDGTVQLSPGYDVEIHQDGGLFYQRNRIANHDAIVQVARGGNICSLHLDGVSDCAIQILPQDHRIDLDLNSPREPSARTDTEGMRMTAIAIGTRVYNVDGDDGPLLADAVAALLDKQNVLEDERSNFEDKNTQLEDKNTQLMVDAKDSADEIATKNGEIKALEEKLDQANNQRMDEDSIATAIASRMDAWGLVLPAVRQDFPDFQPDWKLDEMGIKRLYLLRQDESLNDDPNFKLDAYVEGLWKHAQPKPVETVSHSDGLNALLSLAKSERVDGYGKRRKRRGMDNDPTLEARRNRPLPGMSAGGSN